MLPGHEHKGELRETEGAERDWLRERGQGVALDTLGTLGIVFSADPVPGEQSP